MADEDDLHVIDRPGLPTQGSSRRAVFVVMVIMALLLGAFLVGFLFSQPGEGFLLIPGG
jgi:hypothetical protein